MLVKNATAYVDGRFSRKDILIRGGKIEKVANRIDAQEELVNAAGLVALPGLIDIHAHLREPGQEWKEDFASGSRAALAGGYSLIYDMPNNSPKPTITKETLDDKMGLAKKAECEVRFHFGATDSNFDEVKKAGPGSLKFYMGKTTGNMSLSPEGALRHMREFPSNRQILVHAQAEGESAYEDEERVRTAITLAKKAARKVHITHVSTARELAIAKSYGKATADVTPHHLFLSTEEGKKMGKGLGLVNPPLRSRVEVEMLWRNLKKVDAVGTDHAPHLVEEKKEGARGFPGLETALALFLDAYSRKLVPLEWIAQRFSENPARIMGLPDCGKIKAGFAGNITLVDLKKDWIVKGEEMETKAKWSPFEGMRLRGRVAKTICRGKVAFEL